ncbi:hypothetical protein Lser_V15G39918 [Lactuca serriola]
MEIMEERLRAFKADISASQGEARTSSFREFKACGAPEFSGVRDPIVSKRWVADIENAQRTSSCLEEAKVGFASCMLRDRARDWWGEVISQMGTVGVASMTWAEFVRRFDQEFAPPIEVQWMFFYIFYIHTPIARQIKRSGSKKTTGMEAISVLSVTHPIESKLTRLRTFCSHKNSHGRSSAQKGNHKNVGKGRHVDKLQYEGFAPDNSTMTTLMLYNANNRFFTQADSIWNEIINSSYNLDIQRILGLIDAYIEGRLFDEVIQIIHQISLRHPQLQHQVYEHTISCFGKIRELELMENILKDMVSNGFPVDSTMGNAYIMYYSHFDSIPMMENAYKLLKSSRLLVEKDGIRAISLAYIRDKKFHTLGNFLRDVGLGRRNAGNLLWNLLLLSYAANFKMKSLQREFLNMLEAGFELDFTTFNIRVVAFSKMSLFWDLHLSPGIEHMKHNGFFPDLVTYGCIVDAYLDRRLGKNLDFALRKMNVNDLGVVLTDDVVFEVLGKGDFHSSSEPLLEFNRGKRRWSYKELIATYVKKKYRSNQIFWNY